MNEEIYGYLIVLGTNGRKSWKYSDTKKETNKLKVVKRKEPNGIKQKKIKKHTDPEKSHAITSKKIHAVSYEMSRSEAYVVEYDGDSNTDMYQIGRCTENQIDFVVNSIPPESKRHSKISSTSETVSRYACRILISRYPPYEARIFAAGFDSDRNIFLGENAIKWKDESTTVDGFTTNGVMIRHPDVDFNPVFRVDNLAQDENSDNSTFKSSLWREVSVSGAIYSCLSRRCVPLTKAKLNETNVLRDGTLIDLCGVTLIWRSSYIDSEIADHVESICGKLNHTHIVCPVGYQTLKICPEYSSWRPNDGVGGLGSSNFPISKSSSAVAKKYQQFLSQDSQPFVYMRCGHVHGYHKWKAEDDDDNNRTCPLCKQRGPFLQLRLGQETGFFLDFELPTHCFNPCGHMASEATLNYWYRVPLPNCKSTEYTTRCPFCYKECINKHPVRLFFHDTD